MRFITVVLLLFTCFSFIHSQTEGINLSEYLKHRKDTLYYNCTYDAFHAKGIHETIKLVYRTILIGRDTAYYISYDTDTAGLGAQLASFWGSAMIFRNDSVLLASLTWQESPNKLTKDKFNYVLPPNMTFNQPVEVASLEWGFTMKVYIKNAEFEDVFIGTTKLKKCLKLNLLIYDRATEPDISTVWLSPEYGMVKWILATGRVEVLELKKY